MLHAPEQWTEIETVVAIVPSIGDMECFDFCHRLLNQWEVGKEGKDNGLAILLITDQRCIQSYTGYDLEGVFPDTIYKRAQTKYMIPYLKGGNWSERMVAGIRATCQRLDGSMENESLSELNNGPMDFTFAAILFAVIGVGVAFFAARNQGRCPKCGRHALQRTGSRFVSCANGVKTEDVIYICKSCGGIIIRRQQSYDNDYHNRGGGGDGSFAGGSGDSGGGSSGSSFGGEMGGGDKAGS